MLTKTRNKVAPSNYHKIDKVVNIQAVVSRVIFKKIVIRHEICKTLKFTELKIFLDKDIKHGLISSRNSIRDIRDGIVYIN